MRPRLWQNDRRSQPVEARLKATATRTGFIGSGQSKTAVRNTVVPIATATEVR